MSNKCVPAQGYWTISIGKCVKYIYVLVTWKKYFTLSVKVCECQMLCNIFRKEIVWRSLYFVLKKVFIFPPLENSWMFSLYVLSLRPFSLELFPFPDNISNCLYYLFSLNTAIPIESVILPTMPNCTPLEKITSHLHFTLTLLKN